LITLSACGNKGSLYLPTRSKIRIRARTANPRRASEFFFVPDGTLCAEGVSLVEIARQFGTPAYVYSRAAIERGYREFSDACSGRDVLICYSVKANSISPY